MPLSGLLVLCYLLGLGSAWNQPSTCYVRQSSCSSGDNETLVAIQQTLSLMATSQQTIQQTLSVMATSLNRLVGKWIPLDCMSMLCCDTVHVFIDT